MSLYKESLRYHKMNRPGKLEIRSTKPCHTEKNLSLAYSPGVAAPCLEIKKNNQDVYKYTNKGNLVAVISNGTAVLGLGNIGALASKPVMEGKAVLFKQFANIDVFDIELNSKNPKELIQIIKALEPTFGGINLEDIKAPECFYIEKTLKEEMNIPVFHDDQHGTAIISGAALINAALITNRKLNELKLVVNGAGASALSCTDIFIRLGVKPENIIVCDSKGVIFKGRTERMNEFKEKFAIQTNKRTLVDALDKADVFVGLSVGNVLTGDMLKSMNKNPIVFAMANPDPEVDPVFAMSIRKDIIIATGRSDFPNQVNNVLGFPFIFRGALDVRATTINEEMKLAAIHALAHLAREDVPENVTAAYGGQNFTFGRNYIIPKPFDPRVLLWVAPAVAKAAMQTGVARKHIPDFEAYHDQLEAISGPSRVFVRSVIHTVKSKTKDLNCSLPKIVFAEGTSTRILKTIHLLREEQVCHPIVLGDPEKIHSTLKKLDLHGLDDLEIINPHDSPLYASFVDRFHQMRHHRGIIKSEAKRLMTDSNYFGSMMVHEGLVDTIVSGATQKFIHSVRPILKTIGTTSGHLACGYNLVLTDDRILILADTTVNIDPSAEELKVLALQSIDIAKYFNINPRIALLGYSNFLGQGELSQKIQKAVKLIQDACPDIPVDGELQADSALSSYIQERIFPYSKLQGGANILIFPNLSSSNIAFKLLSTIGKVEVIGPLMTGFAKPVCLVQRTTSVEMIFYNVVLTIMEILHNSKNTSVVDI